MQITNPRDGKAEDDKLKKLHLTGYCSRERCSMDIFFEALKKKLEGYAKHVNDSTQRKYSPCILLIFADGVPPI